MNTYAKLRSGEWGLRGSDFHPGMTVTVCKRDGSRKSETVGRILWTGDDGTQLATIEKVSAPSDETCYECGRHARLVPCQDSSGIMGLCCPQCASYSRFERSFA